MRTRGKKNKTKRQYRKSFTKRRAKRTKKIKKSSKSNNDLKKFKKLEKKLEKLFMTNASKKEIDETSKQLADLQKKMIKTKKKKMKGGGEVKVQQLEEEVAAARQQLDQMKKCAPRGDPVLRKFYDDHVYPKETELYSLRQGMNPLIKDVRLPSGHGT